MGSCGRTPIRQRLHIAPTAWHSWPRRALLGISLRPVKISTAKERRFRMAKESKEERLSSDWLSVYTARVLQMIRCVDVTFRE